MDDINDKDELKPVLATLNTRQESFLSQLAQDIRATVSHLFLPKVSALSVLSTSAIDSLKDLYYALNTEDPLNSMPVRRHVLATNIPKECLLPIAIAADADPAADRNRKRWSLPMYQTLRLLSVLTLPISTDSELASPAQLDYLLLDLRAHLASHRSALAAFVTLLQYYIDRKAEKRAALAPAEQSKVEDARIDNILRFFCNILSPPRTKSGEAILNRDRAVHLALVGSLIKVEFFSTLAVLFSSAEDAHAHYTDLVFLIADIFALAYRHTSPYQLITVHREQQMALKSKKTEPIDSSEDANAPDIYSRDPFETGAQPAAPLHVVKPSFKPSTTNRGPNLRDALMRERALIGGSRAITSGARWTSRHSGGFSKTPKGTSEANAPAQSTRTPNGVSNLSAKRILSAKGAVQTNKAFNPKHEFQQSMQINSQLLCQLATQRRMTVAKLGKRQSLPTVRRDLQEDGISGLVGMTSEMIDICFQFFIRELRARILDTKERAKAEETESLRNANCAFLTLVGSIVGFHREKCGKVYKQRDSDASENGSISSSQVHQNNMTVMLSSDFKIIKTAWKAIEGAIELESFQIVFGVLVDACLQLRESGRDESKLKMVELATFAVLEMMKMLQGMAADVPQEIEEADEAKQGDLTPREIALNTLELLFERESFLNAPADLAKQYTSKLFSFRHLSNIVEMAHTFTTILLDEQELATLQVAKRRKRAKVKKINDADAEEDYKPDEADESTMGETLKDTSEENKTQANDPIAAETAPVVNSGLNTKSKDDELMKGVDRSSGDGVELDDGNVEKGLEASKVRKMLQDDEENGGVDSDGLVMDKGDEASRIRKVLHADRENGGVDADGLVMDKSDLANDLAEDGEASRIRKMLQADEENGGVDSDGLVLEKSDLAKDMVEDGELSKIKKMLEADEQTGAVDQNELVMNKGESKVEKMLLSDQRADIEGGPKPKENYVTLLDGIDGEGNDSQDDDEDDDEEINLGVREVESIGIVRRFANSRAIETLLVPMRAAMCQASDLSGKIFPIPDGCDPVISPAVVAKSACVASAIWKVAKSRDRGSLCGQFFSFSVMQLFSIALTAEEEGGVNSKSVLSHFCGLAKDVTDTFFKWLETNPGLMYDMFLMMDNSYMMSFARKVNANEPSRRSQETREGKEKQKSKRKYKKKEDKNNGEAMKTPSSPDYWNDNELSTSDGDDDGNGKEQLPKWGITEDEDVEDFDALEIGKTSSPVPEREITGKEDFTMRKLPKRRRIVEEEEDTDDFDALEIHVGKPSSAATNEHE